MDTIRFIDDLLRRDEKSGAQELLDLLKNPYAPQVRPHCPLSLCLRTGLTSPQLAQISVYASLGTSIGFTLLLAIGFSLLRPYNSVVYAPKLKVADDKHSPPRMGKGIFAWFGPVLGTKEQELIPLIGLDAIIFLRILRMCRNMFVVLSVLGCGILIPINLIKGQKYSTTTFITRVTPVNTYGDANWGMTICAWLFNAVVAVFLWLNYRVVVRLRVQYYGSPEYQSSLHARTLMVSDICIQDDCY
jgi:hypothetical protein